MKKTSASSLAGCTALVTGASRRQGIGCAIASKLAARGANIVLHHFIRPMMRSSRGGR